MSAGVDDEIALLEEFKSQLDNDILLFLEESDHRRFLRARKWNVGKAVTMCSTWWTWYNSPIQGSDNITPRTILNTIEDPKEDIYRRLLPHSNFSCSKTGQPIYWERTGQISSRFSEISEHLNVDDLVIRHIRQQEMAVRRCNHYSEEFGHLVESQVIVFNLEGLSYALDTNALAAFRATLSIDQDYYPERLHTLFMINAPWFFQAVWAIISPWIDPVTANKIKIVGSDYLPALRELIDDDKIPVQFGGSCENVVFEWPFPDHTYCSPSILSRPLKNEILFAERKNGANNTTGETVTK